MLPRIYWIAFALAELYFANIENESGQSAVPSTVGSRIFHIGVVRTAQIMTFSFF